MAQALGAPGEDQRGDQQQKCEHCRHDGQIGEADRGLPDAQEDLVEVHGACIDRFAFPEMKWPVRTGRVRTGP